MNVCVQFNHFITMSLHGWYTALLIVIFATFVCANYENDDDDCYGPGHGAVSPPYSSILILDPLPRGELEGCVALVLYS